MAHHAHILIVPLNGWLFRAFVRNGELFLIGRTPAPRIEQQREAA